MIKQMAWNTFKNTGSIDSYLELVKVENIERDLGVNLKSDLSQEYNSNFASTNFGTKGNNTFEEHKIKNNLGENIGVDTQFYNV